jgi:hypothetical protein
LSIYPEEINKSYLFANGLNGLNRLAHLCSHHAADTGVYNEVGGFAMRSVLEYISEIYEKDSRMGAD